MTDTTGSLRGPRSDVALIATHVAPARGFGGVAESAAALARAWSRQGRAFSLTASDGTRGLPIDPSQVGLPLRIPVRLYRARGAIRWGFGPGGPAAVWAACRDAKAVYVCGIATWPTTLAYAFCRLLRRPYVAAVRGGLMPAHVAHIRRSKPLKWLYYRLFVLPALHGARAVHAASALEHDGIPPLVPTARIAVVPNGVDLSFWTAQPARFEPESGLKLCYVGRFSREKGILRFLTIWLKVCRPGDLLTLVGTGESPYAEEVRRLALANPDAVTLAGERDREGVRDALAACDFAVLPSGIEAGDVRENFGNALAEALAAGRPVLVTRGLAWDDLDRLGAGILFDADDADVEAAILSAQRIEADAYRAKCSAARAYAEAHFDLDVAAARLWSVICGEPITGQAGA